MPRIARVVGVGLPHHITQRGNYRQQIFKDDNDRQQYLSFLRAESVRYGVTILAYCLMPNHLHCIAVPKRQESMGNTFKYVNMKYSQYFNRRSGERGHLFQGRFFSSIMDERYTMACARYIERNPVRAQMVEKAWEWRWSSSKVHCGMDKKDDLAVKGLFDYIDFTEDEWKEFIKQEDDPGEVATIKRQTLRGRPIASVNFIEKMEKKLKRVLLVKTKGRPKKKDKKETGRK